MYFVNALALFLGGLLPLLIARRRLPLNRACFLLGWLSWACAVSPKIVLLSAIWSVSPYLSKPDTVPHIMTVASLEVLEVVSAYLFLSRHPRLRGATASGLFTFALGFGVGEAFTLSISALVPVNAEYYAVVLFILMVTAERALLVAIQFGWLVFLAHYLATRERIDIVLSLCFKTLLPVITLAVPIIFFMHDIVGGVSVLYYEMVVAAYAAAILSLAFLWRKKIGDLGSTTVPSDFRSVLAGAIAFAGLTIAVDTSLPLLYLIGITRWVTEFLVLTLSTIVLFELFSRATYGIRLSECALGAFIGVLLENLYRLSLVKGNLLLEMTMQAILFKPSLVFLAVLVGMALWSLSRN